MCAKMSEKLNDPPAFTPCAELELADPFRARLMKWGSNLWSFASMLGVVYSGSPKAMVSLVLSLVPPWCYDLLMEAKTMHKRFCELREVASGGVGQISQGHKTEDKGKKALNKGER